MHSYTRIACALTPEELPSRLAEISAIGRDALLSVSPDGTLRFRADGETRRRLEAIVAAEARCCSFLTLDLHEHAGAMVLSVTAPEGAESLAHELLGAFTGRESPEAGSTSSAASRAS
jgi:hypothetical protein